MKWGDEPNNLVYYKAGETFPIKVKNPVRIFFCPLCRHERVLTHHENLTLRHYVQIILLSLIVAMVSYPWMQARSFIFFFIIWGVFEGICKLFFRTEIPCPHCGLDLIWYKRDLQITKKLIKEFWENKK